MNKNSNITTESINERTKDFSFGSTEDMIGYVIDDLTRIKEALNIAKPQIVKLTDKAFEIAKNGGRIVYIGAGTSGRLGVLDASEILPTFNNGDTFFGLIAGGDTALRNPIESVEDNPAEGEKDLKEINLTNKDMVIGLAASGRTPYVIGGLQYAKSIGAETGSICTSSDTAISAVVNFPVESPIKGEVITGSTRMSSGTVQKTILNALSTSVMAKLGKVYGNLMVNVRPSNGKLVIRAENIVKRLTNGEDQAIKDAFKESNNNTIEALVMVSKNISNSEAKELLKEKNISEILNK